MTEEKKNEIRKVLGNFTVLTPERKHNKNSKLRPVSSIKKIDKNAGGKNVNGKVQYRMCKSKVRYPTEARATIMANKIGKKRNVVLRSYYCEYCNGYHLTKQKRKF